MKIDYQDSIDRYIMGQMSDKERESFETKCAENPELKEQLEHTRKVRTVISARSRILEMVQKWDEDYEAENKATEVNIKTKVVREKKLVLYWLSGIAAVFVVGFFLFSAIHFPESEKPGNTISMNQKDDDMYKSDNTTDSIEEKVGQENLLAKSDLGGKEKKKESIEKGEENMDPINQNSVYSFGNESFKMEGSTEKDEYVKELIIIDVELQKIIEKTEQNDQLYSVESVDKEGYEKTAKNLKNQADQFLWKKARILIALNRKSEALTILDEMRKTKGKFQNKADSLYIVTINNE